MKRFASLVLLFCVSFQDNGLASGSPTPGPSVSPAPSVAPDPAAAAAFRNKDFNKVIELLSGKVSSLGVPELILLGKSYEFKMNIVAALGVYQVGSAHFPDNSELKANLGKVTWQSGFQMEADLYLAKNTDYQKKIKAKENDGIEILRQVIVTDKTYQPAYLLLGQIYETKSNWLEMQNLYLDMAKVFGDTPEIAEKLCTVSVAYSSFELATKYCNLCIQLNSKAASCAVSAAEIKVNTGQTDEGKVALKAAAEQFPNFERAQMSYADLSKQNKNFGDALIYYERALSINPKSKSAMAGAAECAFELQNFETSLKWASALCDIDYPSISILRKSVSVLKAAHNEAWLKKYQESVDSCRSKNTKSVD